MRREGVDLEKNHFFAVRSALINVWLHPEREKQKAVLESAALWLSAKAEELFEKKRISEAELKRRSPPPTTCSKGDITPKGIGKLFPIGIKEKLTVIMSQMGLTTPNLLFVKALLLENFGIEVEGDIEALLETIKEELGEIKPGAQNPTVITWSIKGVATAVYQAAMNFLLARRFTPLG